MCINPDGNDFDGAHTHYTKVTKYGLRVAEVILNIYNSEKPVDYYFRSVGPKSVNSQH
jgi:hypothetical protein